MRIKNLQVANLRSFDQAKFDFQEGMNLLVGVNGVGKTTVLDALCICLSRILPNVTASRSRPLPFVEDDIRVHSNFMTVNCSFKFQGTDFTYLVHKNRESSVPRDSDKPREQVWETPDKEDFQPPLPSSFKELKKEKEQPLGIFFSTRRSLVSDASPSTASAAGRQAAAFADALSRRELRLQEIAYWIRAQEAQGAELPLVLKHLVALKRAAKCFLPECDNLRADKSPKPRLLVDKAGKTLDLRQLSDGERGMFALVLDLAQRLSQANPKLEDPVKNGSAIVLIDEIDLHLHPKWQRSVVMQLTETFPNCQFIATTHSPQIVAAVEPEQVLLFKGSDIIRPDRTLGMDTNWILRFLMETDDRPSDASKAILDVEALIRESNFKNARLLIDAKRNAGLDLPEWSVLEARMARMELLAE
ncbi:MAG: AAA family ATPase [Syntrophales bacterium]|jgi:predicted ATP-binding protein involved in virulence|nr:AAA family ATPase [Syntrophales bacterium]